MAQSIVVKSFAELAELIDFDDLPIDPPANGLERAVVSTLQANGVGDLQGLLVELEAASSVLTTVAREDQEARELALRGLEDYESLLAHQREAQLAVERAQRVRQEAAAVATSAFTEAARTAAKRVAEMAAQLETAAGQLVDNRRQAAECLALRLDLERTIAVRRQQEAAEQARVAEAERDRQLSDTLMVVREALQAKQFEQASELLVSVASEHPDNAEIAALWEIVVQRSLALKMSAAEETLWVVRRELRQDPSTAIERLEGLDVDGLPEPLARQVFGEWARACARFCLERCIAAPLRYAPDPGRGAIIARDSSGSNYTVVSSLGMGPAWRPGSVVSDHYVRRARPLRLA